MSALSCSFCRRPMAYIHGHAACVFNGCPLYGQNQAECCDGATAEQCPLPTSGVHRGPAPVDDRTGSD
jgi:hypothetical protein